MSSFTLPDKLKMTKFGERIQLHREEQRHIYNILLDAGWWFWYCLLDSKVWRPRSYKSPSENIAILQACSSLVEITFFKVIKRYNETKDDKKATQKYHLLKVLHAKCRMVPCKATSYTATLLSFNAFWFLQERNLRIHQTEILDVFPP